MSHNLVFACRSSDISPVGNCRTATTTFATPETGVRRTGLGIFLHGIMNFTYLAAVAALLSLLAPASVTQAASLNGAWSGGGYITPGNGKRERVSCRVSYSRQSSKVYSVAAVCATTSAKIRQSGEVLMVRPNLFVGDFYNREFDISGRIRVIIRGSRQTVTMSSSSGGGRLSLRKR